MENTSYIALSRQSALWREMEVVANNMANANTPSYKAQQMMFKDFVVKTKTDTTPFGRKVDYVQDVGVLRDTREGPMTQTQAPLDIAIHNDGYFVVDTPTGQRYTREGHFRLDETGMMVNSAGYPVLQTTGQPIVFAPNESQINVTGDGTVSTENGVIGKIRVVGFDNDQSLQSAGSGMYMTTSQPNDIATPSVVQGMLEQSNVQPVIETTKMMDILRNYEGIQKLIDGENDRQSTAMKILSQTQQSA
ncbi:MAG TPA: flagellar basal-body rod protein FlgF [Candidatus Sulfotelmatobacter sp.]|jgi:flagellar basal-body rod protein FlgF|nr:flagellar basal-body rod protein FlgF [Candidatus Sulfotelmatobacter sp.]